MNDDEARILLSKLELVDAAMTRLRRDNAALIDACHAARRFIVNGVECKYIRLPDADLDDPAHNTLPTLVAAIAQAQEPQP